MKFHRVTITGFGAYRGTETIDFDRFDNDGIFVITGRTGAGKSTILDAITFALFGHVPRYGRADEQVRSEYLRDTRDPTEVTVEFTVDSGRYRVTRRPSYFVPERRGALPAAAELSIWRDETWQVLAAKPREVGHQIDSIVQLNAAQFQQVILLAQGQFQDFLVADSAERVGVLRKLFDTQRFERYSDELAERAARQRKDLEHTERSIATTVANLAATVGEADPGLEVLDADQVLGWVRPLEQRTAHAADVAERQSEQAQQRHEHATHQLQRMREIADAQDKRAKALRRLTALESDVERITALRGRLDRAHEAEIAWPAVRIHRTRVGDLHAAHEALDSATVAWRQHGADAHNRAPQDSRDAPDPGVEDAGVDDPNQLAARVDVLTGQLTTLADAERAEVSAGQDQAELTRLTATVEAADQNITRLDELVVALRADREATTAQVLEHQPVADTLAVLDQTVLATRAQLTAARRVTQTRADLAQTRQRESDAALDQADASARRADLLVRRLAGHAATLASELRPDEPCPVCGSVQHPRPAEPSDDHVTDDDIDRVDALVDQTTERLADIRSQLATLHERLTQSNNAAGHQDETVLEAQVLEVQAQAQQARQAALQLTALHDKTADIDRQLGEAATQRETAVQQRTHAQEQVLLARQRIEHARELIDRARGGEASVADRRRSLATEKSLAVALIDASNRLASSRRAMTEAESELARVLALGTFDSAHEVESARLDPDERQRLQHQVTVHDAERAAVNEALDDPRLVDVPDEPVDTAPWVKAAAEASAAHDQAAKAAGSARSSADHVATLAASIAQALSAAGRARDEHQMIDQIARAVRGREPNTRRLGLETFALAADLADVLTAANALLGSMTGHRFHLEHRETPPKGTAQAGLDIQVIDAYNSEARSPQSLSGGEKFQASLALALGLAEVVSARNGGVRLDTLFIDEGFGSLDSDTLDDVLDTIDTLRQGGRTVGLISHVDQVKERIAHHIEVRVDDQGWSTLS